MKRLSSSLLGLAVLGCAAAALAAGEVRVVAPPGKGAVPDAKTDGKGVIHLGYVSGENVYYAASADAGKTFSEPLRVNSDPNTAHPPNVFRGPEIAIGRNDQVHVIWYTSAYQRKLPKDQWGVHYSRLSAGHAAFEPARNLNHKPSDNFSVAADDKGNVAVFWMADGLFVNWSRDDGKTFSEPIRVPPADTCECCASRAAFGLDGSLFCLYRDKANNDRDMYLIGLPPGARNFSRAKISGGQWQVNGCPMTGAFLSRGADGLFTAAWETKGQIFFGRIGRDGRLLAPGEIATPRSDRPRRYPVALAAPDGTVLVAWKKGTTLEWQLYDASGKPQGGIQSRPGASMTRPAGTVTKDGDFLLFP